MKKYTINRVTVYCASSRNIADGYFKEGEKFGQLMAQQNWTLVYGGGGTGLMGQVANSIQKYGGKTLGITPEVLKIDSLVNTRDDEQIITRDMPERKNKMIEMADAFVALPGGFGTLEELFEVMTLKQLGFHQKPIVIASFHGYYEKMLAFFEVLYQQKFAKATYRQLYHIADNADDIIDYLNNYQPPNLDKHWFV